MSESSATYANAFATVFEQAAQIAKTEKQKIESDIAGLEIERERLVDRLDDLYKRLGAIDEDVALGLKIAAKNAGVRLELNSGAARPKRSGGVKQRLSQAELAAATTAVIKVLPTQNGMFMSVSEIAEKADIDPDGIRAALRKLRTEKHVESNGVKGFGSGWRKL